jgi:hypothetical protein
MLASPQVNVGYCLVSFCPYIPHLTQQEERQMLIIKTCSVVFLCLSLLVYLSDNWAMEPFWLSRSYSYTVIKRTQPNFKWRLVQWTAFLVLPGLLWVLQHLEPLMTAGDWKLQPPVERWKDPLVKEDEQIFRFIDFSGLPVPKRGPKRNPLEVYANVFLSKVNQKIQYSSELREFFFDHPQLIPLVGFYRVYNPSTGALDVEKTVGSARHLRRKLQTIENQHLKLLLKNTVDQLQEKKLLTGTAIADTTDILAWVTENNLKQRVDNRFDKTRPIKGFLQCSLGAKPVPGEKDNHGKPKMRYFWGAKQAALGEHTQYGTAFLYEDVFTAKTADVKTALPTLKPLVERWGYRLKKFLADAAYDAFEIYQSVSAKDTPEPTSAAATAYIALNARGHTRLHRQCSKNGNLICEANLEMTNGGQWFDKDKGDYRQKFTCPLVKQPGKHNCGPCPINHETFQKNGCSRYLNRDDQEQLRFKVHRDSQEDKDTFKQRTFVEQAFSSLKEHSDIELPKVRNLDSVKNISTIAAILNNVQILQKATSQSTQKPGEEDPQDLGVLRV